MASQSVIGAGTTIRGTIRGDVDIEILGSVEGSVLVQGEVIIGETALIKSDVRARRVIVRGAVRGNVS
ncbi:MAG: polymer-forming cytoskeletal protein, partial [Polyangiaceae bacterium]